MHHQLLEDELVGNAALFTARKFAYAGLFCPISGKAMVNRPKAAAAIVSQFSHHRSLVVATWLHYPLRYGLATRQETRALAGSTTCDIIDEVMRLHLPIQPQQQDLMDNLGNIGAISAESQLIVLADWYYLLEVRCDHGDKPATDYARWLSEQIDGFDNKNEHLIKRLQQLMQTCIE